MTDTFRALCAELLKEFSLFVDSDGDSSYISDDEKESQAHVKYARALITRARAALALELWGRPTAAPAPEPGELVAELELMANHAATACQFGDAETLSAAAALLQQLSAPAPVVVPVPVPVSERLPGPEDCNAEGRCWWFTETYPRPVGPGAKFWELARFCPGSVHWLPAHAIPLPQAGEGE